jgi:hypothetical protein
MPLLLYFPFIVWMGMVKVAQHATHHVVEPATGQPLIQRRNLYLVKR